MTLWEFACVVAPHVKRDEDTKAGQAGAPVREMSDEDCRALGITGF